MATSSIFSDLPLGFIPNPITGDVRPITNEAAVKSALDNLLRTPLGSRRFLPDFGTRLEQYLFQPADAITESELNEELASAIRRFEPRVNLVSIESTMEDYGIEITITYYIQNIPGLQTLETVIERTK